VPSPSPRALPPSRATAQRKRECGEGTLSDRLPRDWPEAGAVPDAGRARQGNKRLLCPPRAAGLRPSHAGTSAFRQRRLQFSALSFLKPSLLYPPDPCSRGHHLQRAPSAAPGDRGPNLHWPRQGPLGALNLDTAGFPSQSDSGGWLGAGPEVESYAGLMEAHHEGGWEGPALAAASGGSQGHTARDTTWDTARGTARHNASPHGAFPVPVGVGERGFLRHCSRGQERGVLGRGRCSGGKGRGGLDPSDRRVAAVRSQGRGLL